MAGLNASTIHPDDSVRWETPAKAMDAICSKLKIPCFDIDAACSLENKKAEYAITAEMDCLTLATWIPEELSAKWLTDSRDIWAWINPPYNKPERRCATGCNKSTCEKRGYHLDRDLPGMQDFVAAAAMAATRDKINVVALLPANLDPSWFHHYVIGRAEKLWAVDGRIQFELDGVPSSNSSIANMFVWWKPGSVKKYGGEIRLGNIRV